MALVTPARLRAIYVMLQHVPPFDRWNLPPVGNIKFEILRDETLGEFSLDERDRFCVGINADTHTTLAQVVETMAHELVHIRQEQLGRLPFDHAKQHNAEFRRMARHVCRALGFDVQRF
jgi:hypothetical protein